MRVQIILEGMVLGQLRRRSALPSPALEKTHSSVEHELELRVVLLLLPERALKPPAEPEDALGNVPDEHSIIVGYPI